eukprot:SAG22_NODE_159_length_16948_cov_14.480503_3_plen_78_part_00
MALKGRDPREYAVTSKRFVSDGAGNVKGVETVRVEWQFDEATGRHNMVELPGTEVSTVVRHCLPVFPRATTSSNCAV